MAKELSIIIPAYNEESCIVQSIHTIYPVLQGLGVDYEILVIDDGSTDTSFDLVEKEMGVIPHLKIFQDSCHRGKGYAVKTGILYSRGGLVCYLDADLALRPSYLGRFLDTIKEGYDIVIASRFVPGATYSAPLLRRFITHACIWLRKLLVGMPEIQDTQCGFKVMRGDLARKICEVARIDRYCFDIELLFLAGEKGAKIKEIAVELTSSSGTHIKIVKDTVESLIDLLRIKKNDLLGVYAKKAHVDH